METPTGKLIKSCPNFDIHI